MAINNDNIRQYVNYYIEGNVQLLPPELRDKPIGDWDVSNVTDMSKLFSDKKRFNEPLNNWNVSNVTNMEAMFLGATSFNQPLNDWDVSNVTSMRDMFDEAKKFNQPLNNWNVSNVTNMEAMFLDATSFNQPLNDWDVSNVTNMRSMFMNARSFNQPLNNWNVSIVTNIDDMVYGSRRNSELDKLYRRILRERAQRQEQIQTEQRERARQQFDERQQTEGERNRTRIEAQQNVEYPDCSICMEPLDNIHGPPGTTGSRDNDVLNVCDSNHLFHRVCIYNSCTSPLAYRFNCPTCRKPLLKDDKTNIRVCNDLLNKIKLTDEEIKQYGRTGGGRSRSRSRTRKISGGYGKRKLSSYTKKKKINKRIKKSKTRRVKK